MEICTEGNDNDSDYMQPDGNGNGESDTTELQPVPPQFQMLEVQDDTPNPNVYDEHHQLLQRGEKIRLGKVQMRKQECFLSLT